MNNTYWKEKYADYHSRAESKIAEIEKENAKLKEKLETLQDEIGHLQQVLLQIKDIAMCGGDCEYDCDHCMQGQIHQLIKEALNGRKD